jgi:serine/threonine-protein kinase RsbW
MAPTRPVTIRLDFTGAFEMVDFAEIVGSRMCHDIGLDDDATHWVMLAIRESVINAIKHGNRDDATKRVFVEFETVVDAVPELTIRVRDEGDGFDPDDVADALATENLQRGSGRGIFLIRTFMDEVELRRAPEGGMQVRMVKRAQRVLGPGVSSEE